MSAAEHLRRVDERFHAPALIHLDIALFRVILSAAKDLLWN
jgi:hypothetical protein